MSQIYVALVEQNGTVRTMISGDVTEEKVNELRAAYE
jgi:anti-sigma28 factor (negative regulator of flagellin synthesis)